ncbi:MAG: hypothetical protein KAU07_01585 [Candidatus Andersenbacteria bacterium]|nr:hypothetical protein [Candidatus Andersenbacteria bacterium]
MGLREKIFGNGEAVHLGTDPEKIEALEARAAELDEEERKKQAQIEADKESNILKGKVDAAEQIIADRAEIARLRKIIEDAGIEDKNADSAI